MTARKRTISESFSAYRENLKAEARALKQRLAGRYAWVSKIIVKENYINALGEIATKLRYAGGRGTYRKES